MISYSEKDTFVHRLSGFTKLVFFLLWTVTAMLTYDTRVLAVMIAISAVLFFIARTEWRQVSAVFKAVLFFLSLNLVAVFLFSPYEGCKIYGGRIDLLHIAGRYTLTAEQLFYELNIMLKYCTIVPSVFMFITATDPSEFAASLNMVGVPYTAGYAVALTMRYVPDVQDDYQKIKNAQAARGIEMSRKAGLAGRIRNTATILFPLIFTSMERIDVVSSAMELRGFGKKRRRTWYAARPLSRADWATLCVTVLFCAAALVLTFYDGSRFFNPFR